MNETGRSRPHAGSKRLPSRAATRSSGRSAASPSSRRAAAGRRRRPLREVLMSLTAADPVPLRPPLPAAEPRVGDSRATARVRRPSRPRSRRRRRPGAGIVLRLYTQIGRLREQERLDAWAYQVARNVIADYWRDRAAHHDLPVDRNLDKRVVAENERRPRGARSTVKSARAARGHWHAPRARSHPQA